MNDRSSWLKYLSLSLNGPRNSWGFWLLLLLFCLSGCCNHFACNVSLFHDLLCNWSRVWSHIEFVYSTQIRLAMHLSHGPNQLSLFEKWHAYCLYKYKTHILYIECHQFDYILFTVYKHNHLSQSWLPRSTSLSFLFFLRLDQTVTATQTTINNVIYLLCLENSDAWILFSN